MPVRLPKIHEVADGLWVGPVPGSPELIRKLRVDHGITGLVSLQTDKDLETLGLSWPLLWRFLLTNQINTARVPIVDFNDRSLLDGLSGAVDAVNDMRRGGHTTYLHCTAGVNRSPTVAIAWLVRDCGMSLYDAWNQVTERRPCDPHRAVLQRWIDRG